MKYFLIISFLILSSCVHKLVKKVLPSKGIEVAEVGKIKRVAIVAFDVMQFRPTGVGSKFIGTLGTVQTAQNMEAEVDPLALDIYGELTQQIKTERKWAVLPLSELLANKEYCEMFEKKRSQFGAKMAANSYQKALILKGVMRPINPEYLFTPIEIQQISRALNVDGIILAEVSYQTQRNDITGLGVADIYLTSVLRFYMFDALNGKRIWYDQGFEGPASDESLGRVSGLEDKSKIDKLSLPLAQQTVEMFFNSTKQESR